MALMAVPDYVSRAAEKFEDVPAGHRFNLYFPVWNVNWSIDKDGKAGAVRNSLKLGSAAAVLRAMNTRQLALAEALPRECGFVIEARSTAPFATGLGLEHPIENGFAFLSPYGLPYLAGSGVKGILRHAAEELHGVDSPIVNALFGPQDTDDAKHGALSCWDVFPVPPNDALVVEIMTPHFTDYYQNGKTPHDAGKPNPIPFLAVPAGSAFRFVIVCIPALLTSAVALAEWKPVVEQIVMHAFEWLGFGAKTAVGYGALERLSDDELKGTREQAAAARARCQWVDDTIREISARNKVPEHLMKDTLRGSGLAEAWQALTDTVLKQRALSDIRARWDKEGWWAKPPGKAAKKARDIYEPGA